MSLTVDLTAAQHDQLAALLADTTPGAAHYRPPVARDTWMLRELEHANLCRFTDDCGYELTEAGRDVVTARAMDEADGEAFLRSADPDQLRETIRKLKAVFNDLTDPVVRERTLMDIEAVQDALDAHVERPVEGTAETSGRHHRVEPDDRPTETIDRVELPLTEPMPIVGTLPGVPVIRRDPPDVPDQESAERLIAAIKGADTGDDVLAALASQQTDAGWAALEADLADERSWLRRNLTLGRAVLLSVVATVVVTWFVAWLVMG